MPILHIHNYMYIQNAYLDTNTVDIHGYAKLEPHNCTCTYNVHCIVPLYKLPSSPHQHSPPSLPPPLPLTPPLPLLPLPSIPVPNNIEYREVLQASNLTGQLREIVGPHREDIQLSEATQLRW